MYANEINLYILCNERNFKKLSLSLGFQILGISKSFSLPSNQNDGGQLFLSDVLTGQQVDKSR